MTGGFQGPKLIGLFQNTIFPVELDNHKSLWYDCLTYKGVYSNQAEKIDLKSIQCGFESHHAYKNNLL